MSKKDKSKFRKQIKAQLNQEMNQAPANSKAKDVVVVSNPLTETLTNLGEINLPQIKYDLKKTGVVVTILVMITVGFYYADSRYGILLNFGDWLFKNLHIN